MTRTLHLALVAAALLPLSGCCCNPFAGLGEVDLSVDSGTRAAAKEEIESTAMLQGSAAASALKKLESKVGGSVKYLEIDVYPDHVEAKVAARGGVEHYEVDENGTIEGPRPVNLVGGGDLSANLFVGSEVSLAKVPELGAAAVKAVGKGGRVERVSFKRNLPFDQNVRVKAFVMNDDGDTLGHRMTALDGKEIEVDREY